MDHDRIADTPVRWGDQAVVAPEGPEVPVLGAPADPDREDQVVPEAPEDLRRKTRALLVVPEAPVGPAVHPVVAVGNHLAQAAKAVRLQQAPAVVDAERRTTDTPRCRSNPFGTQKTPKTLLDFAQAGSFRKHSAVRPAALSLPRREAYRRRLEVPLGPT